MVCSSVCVLGVIGVEVTVMNVWGVCVYAVCRGVTASRTTEVTARRVALSAHGGQLQARVGRRFWVRGNGGWGGMVRERK